MTVQYIILLPVKVEYWEHSLQAETDRNEQQSSSKCHIVGCEDIQCTAKNVEFPWNFGHQRRQGFLKWRVHYQIITSHLDGEETYWAIHEGGSQTKHSLCD